MATVAEKKSVTERVIEVVHKQLCGIHYPINKITRRTHLVNDLGADSLSSIELEMELEEEFSDDDFELKLPDGIEEELQTVGRVIDEVERQIKAAKKMQSSSK